MFQPTFKRKSIPNRYAVRPVITFKADLETQRCLQRFKNKDKSRFINSSIKMHYQLLYNTKRFLLDLVQLNYQLVKHILRQVGK